ncbi:hypothetical protein EV424DRAFT_1326815 [Suillus variegatus]|nr:hypothetical protein EV424DRAFT_1326815 [Suillus variegatus]
MLPPPPSLLLCPCHTFLTSLILASKFMQDYCYSNCTWAELSGLTPPEISCCECALGELPTAPAATGCTLTKCKSESNMLLIIQ